MKKLSILTLSMVAFAGFMAITVLAPECALHEL